MTLKEKFKQCKNKRNTYFIIPIIEDIEQLEQIADSYAIAFANWLFNIDKEVLSKQLKEFKKEKGL
jgi:RecG-like helicase